MTSVEVLHVVVNVAFLAASAGAVSLWWRGRSPATNWLVATFLAFDVIILMSLLPDESLETEPLVRVLVLLLLGTPYLLFRFADAVVDAPSWARRTADVLVAVVAVTTILLPSIPSEDVESTLVQTVWTVLALVTWVLMDVGAGWLLAGASRGQPGVVRRRMRLLATAAIGLGLYVPVSSTVVGADASAGAEVASQLVALGLGLLFLVGFAPPAALRAVWRHPAERQLQESALGLMRAVDPAEVAGVVVDGARSLTGAPAVILRDASGHTVAQSGVAARGRDGQPLERERRSVGGTTLEVVTSPVMPLFGTEEVALLDRLALLGELAMDRVRLLAAERAAREDVERLNGELESFLYSTSHDLKNPVIALQGYLDVLEEDHADVLEGDLAHIVARMQVNARHMDSLIRDLLALSRVGRVDVVPEVVEVSALLDDLVADARARGDRIELEQRDLPTVWMNATRCRQLFGNLVDNAVRHAGRDSVRITASAVTSASGGVRITVRDDGRGIEPEHLERVFGVFERLDPEHTPGTGMGLAISRRIVQHVGGAMRAVASPDGAVFEIDLPASALAEPTVATSDTLERSPA